MSKTRKWCMLGCFGLICVVLLSIFVRFTTVQIAVKRLHMNNGIIQAILYDNYDLLQLTKPKEEDDKDKKIDWAGLYPFNENYSVGAAATKANDNSGILKKVVKISSKVDDKTEAVEKKVSNWTNKNLIGYQSVIELCNQYKSKLNWDLMVRKEYNGVVEIEDGQLATYCDKEDMSEKVNNVVELANFCKANGAEFVYVSAPSKIDRHEKKYSTLDFSNINADSFLAGLRDNGVKYVDIRDNIDSEGLTTRNLFYRTDHHWLAETGLWATGIVVKYLNDENIVKSDVTLLSSDKWDKEIYENYFLGSRGKKITLERTTPDDITIFHPKFATNLHMEIPSRDISTEGSFDITYDMKPLEKLDYYHKNPYGAYSWGDKPYMYIRNDNSVNDKMVLLIKNSFGNAVLPFLSLQFRDTYELDVRHFTGSVHEFIKQKKPDVVILLYHIEQLNGKIDYTKHNHVWDFR